jgi:pimeloyl-ACP methyl ester carboxylesterase
MKKGFIPYGTSAIHYTKTGGGPIPLIAFHGYGLSAAAFSFLEKFLPEKFTLLAVDLPYHGETDWREGEPMDPGTLADLLLQAIREDGELNAEKIHLLGYSLGGRICLSLLVILSQQVEAVTLVAPDGLHRAFFFRLAMNYREGRRLFRKSMDDPRWLMRLIDAGSKTGLLGGRKRRFLLTHLQAPEARALLYKRWMSLRRFQTARREVARCLLKNNIPLNLVFGIDDPVIRYQSGFKYNRGIGTLCKVFIIAGSHHLLQEENLPSIIPLL